LQVRLGRLRRVQNQQVNPITNGNLPEAKCGASYARFDPTQLCRAPNTLE